MTKTSLRADGAIGAAHLSRTHTTPGGTSSVTRTFAEPGEHDLLDRLSHSAETRRFHHFDALQLLTRRPKVAALLLFLVFGLLITNGRRVLKIWSSVRDNTSAKLRLGPRPSEITIPEKYNERPPYSARHRWLRLGREQTDLIRYPTSELSTEMSPSFPSNCR